MVDKKEFEEFENALVDLPNGESAELYDTDAYLILKITNDEKYAEIQVQPIMEGVISEYDKLGITMIADHLIVERLAAAIKKYPKWW